MKKAVIYSRISTEVQDLSSQINNLKEHYGKDFDIVKVFGEAISGYSEEIERKELETLKTYVDNNQIKTILIWEMSRLGRTYMQTLKNIEYFTEKEVNLIFHKDNIRTLEGGQSNTILIPLLSSLAQVEGDTIRKRTSRGRLEAAKQGKAVGFSNMPLGYRRDENGYLRLNEEEIPLVREIYKMTAGGISTVKIAKEFNARGIPTRTAKDGKKVYRRNNKIYESVWSPKSIQNIIQATRNKGYRTYAGVVIETPKIVDAETWEAANKKIKERIGLRTRVKHNYLLAGKAVCGHCNYSLRVRRKVKETGQELFYYYCDSQILTKEEKCHTGRFYSEELDKHIYDDIILGILNAQVQKNGAKKHKEEINTKILYYEEVLDKLSVEKNRSMTLFKKGLIEEKELDKDTSSITKKMNNTEEEIRRLKLTLEEQKSPKLTWEIMKAKYWDCDFPTKKEMVDEYLQKVVAYRVNHINFDITSIFGYYYEPGDDVKKIRVMKTPKFKKPKQGSVLYYVEIFTYLQKEPQKALVSSVGGINFLSERLEYDIDERSISLNN